MAPSAAGITPVEGIVNINTVDGLTKNTLLTYFTQVVIDKAENHLVTDVDGRQYIDFISQMAVMNYGYSNPRIVKAVVEQVQKITLVNTAFINPLYAQFADRITKKFGFDSIATMLSGSEAVESAIKVVRKWAYVNKGVDPDEAWILTTDHCYHGITLATMSLSNVVADSERTPVRFMQSVLISSLDFGKHLPHVGPLSPSTGKLIAFGELDVLRETFELDGHMIAAFMIEPIQGLAGTRIPHKGYLRAVQDLCHKHNVLFVCDEVQTGFGRTGFDLAFQAEDVKPDLVALGKAVTGGMYPMSVLMGKAHVMDVISKYEIAGTYSASPVACAAALASLDILEEEKISDRSQRLGELLTKTIDELAPPYVLDHRGRGRGLFQTLVLDESKPGVTARRVGALAALRGVLIGIGANRLRFSPPLTIPEDDLVKAITIIVQCIKDVEKLGDFPGSDYLN
ncbi:hypothetical protein G7Z17_g6726 [Cylindrodendrum hubeiense]|uniref:Ornithine aminotransferase n=1 Tax=Cylindrodendrum hubeiense TaxID=595255 RepID=A0A9P5HBS7_9HYPO|nr:hypothetical protein G7Z17_g6726 [Cylindrodendrum hubeiense]